jgi:hypothetical protein
MGRTRRPHARDEWRSRNDNSSRNQARIKHACGVANHHAHPLLRWVHQSMAMHLKTSPPSASATVLLAADQQMVSHHLHPVNLHLMPLALRIAVCGMGIQLPCASSHVRCMNGGQLDALQQSVATHDRCHSPISIAAAHVRLQHDIPLLDVL